MRYGPVSVAFTEQLNDKYFARMEAPLSWNTGPVTTLPEARWLEELSQQAKAATPVDPMHPKDGVVVYLHGFATGFHDAICRAAEIKHRTRFEGIFVVFLWPASPPISVSSIVSAPATYTNDSADAQRSVDNLRAMLEQPASSVSPSRTVLVAHSMGNQPLVGALTKAQLSPQEKYRAVVLLAPDLSTLQVRGDMPDLLRRASRVAMYVNHKDLALDLSANVNGDLRAGKMDLVVNGLETVDITAATGNLGDWLHHSDHLDGTALYDLMWNIVRNMPAKCRGERGLAYQDAQGIWRLNVVDGR